MEDDKIIDLYFARNEAAIRETAAKYGRYCHIVAERILQSDTEAEECVNDTYYRAWCAMPPHRPTVLSAFLGAITRHLALDAIDRKRAQKRQGSVGPALEELEECLPDQTQSNPADALALKTALNGFLAGLSQKSRVIFLQRYFYFCTVKEIADSLGTTQSAVKITLHRTRQKLKAHLEKEEILL